MTAEYLLVLADGQHFGKRGLLAILNDEGKVICWHGDKSTNGDSTGVNLVMQCKVSREFNFATVRKSVNRPIAMSAGKIKSIVGRCLVDGWVAKGGYHEEGSARCGVIDKSRPLDVPQSDGTTVRKYWHEGYYDRMWLDDSWTDEDKSWLAETLKMVRSGGNFAWQVWSMK